MKIAVNMFGIKPGWGGGEELFFRRVLEKVKDVQQGTNFVIVTDPENAESFDGFEILSLNKHAELAGALAKGEIDCLFSTLSKVPRKCPVPTVILIMELFALREKKKAKRLGRSSPLLSPQDAAEEAAGAVVPSKFLKQEVLEKLGIPLDRIVVAPLGLDDQFSQPQPCIVQQPYFLLVGSHSERKNIPMLIEAFGRIADEVSHSLVIVGQPSDEEPDSWGPRVVRIDRVGTAQLAGLYQHSDLVVNPSVYEGSGVLVLEALKAGARVATGRVGGVTEVAGDAPIFFNPESVDSLVGALRRAVKESETDRRRRANASNLLTNDFTWERTAKQTLSAFRRALS